MFDLGLDDLRSVNRVDATMDPAITPMTKALPWLVHLSLIVLVMLPGWFDQGEGEWIW